MLRIWSEFLPYSEARAPAVLDLLERHQVHPIFAVRPDADLAELNALLNAIASRGLSPGIWPLLAKADGYWANESNADAWFERTTAILDALDSRPAWVAVDLEPPLDDVSEMMREIWRLPVALARFARRNLDQARFERSVARWNEVVLELRKGGSKTLGITVPIAAHDLDRGGSLWQDLFETPWAAVDFDRWGVMAYNSMIAGYSRGLVSVEDARAAHDRLIRRLVRGRGASDAHVSIGLTGPGVLGDEPFYEVPEPLAADAGAVRSRGISDIGLFCLEGLLAQDDPDAWLTMVRNAAPMVPPATRRSRLLRSLGHVSRRILEVVPRT